MVHFISKLNKCQDQSFVSILLALQDIGHGAGVGKEMRWLALLRVVVEEIPM
jgi:hypothetical protein